MIFFIFAQNIDREYTLEPPQSEAVLTSTHNICFKAKTRIYYIKVGCKRVYITQTC